MACRWTAKISRPSGNSSGSQGPARTRCAWAASRAVSLSWATVIATNKQPDQRAGDAGRCRKEALEVQGDHKSIVAEAPDAGHRLIVPAPRARRSGRPARVGLMKRKPRLEALMLRAVPCGRAAQPPAGSPPAWARFHAADAAPQPRRLGERRELDDRRMTDVAGGPRCLSRCERRRPEHRQEEC